MLWWICFLRTQLFTSQDVNWWTEVMWIIVMFLSAVWTLIPTAPIHKCGLSVQIPVCLFSLFLFYFRDYKQWWQWIPAGHREGLQKGGQTEELWDNLRRGGGRRAAASRTAAKGKGSTKSRGRAAGGRRGPTERSALGGMGKHLHSILW